jgi:hypothetical protein
LSPKDPGAFSFCLFFLDFPCFWLVPMNLVADSFTGSFADCCADSLV